MSDLRSYIATIHSGKRRSPLALLLLIFLWPISLLFRLIVAGRNFAYDHGIVKGRSLGCKVISIGNLTTGGTGKTPVTILIAERLQKTKRVAILSRGYRSGNEHNSTILHGDELSADVASKVGDELALMASRLPLVWFAVGADRYSSGVRLVKDERIEIAILEDGFQHRQIRCDCDIVLVDASNPFGNGLFLPAGPLREGIRSLKRSSIVLLTRTESVDPLVVDKLQARIARIVASEKIFRLHTDVTAFHELESRNAFPVANRKVWLFSGIGNPESFEIQAVAGGVDVVGHTIFPDHHAYSETDITALNRIVSGGKAELLLTTAKDAVKLNAGAFLQGTCGVMEIGIDFVDREAIFWGIIARSVGAEV